MSGNSENPMERWYNFAAEQQGFVGFALKTIREGRGITAEDQQVAFGTDAEGFRRLQAIPMPRSQKYADDAYRIADACRLLNPVAFVSAMLLVRGVNSFQTKPVVQQYYQAAFDAVSGLDDEAEEK